MFYCKDKDGSSEMLVPIYKTKLAAAQMTIFMYDFLHSNKFCPSGLTSCLQDSTQCLESDSNSNRSAAAAAAVRKSRRSLGGNRKQNV